MKHERAISIVLLISMLSILLLYINFTIWSTSYYDGGLEDQVRQEMKLIEEGGKTNSSLSELVERTFQSLSAAMISFAGILFVFCSFCLLIYIKQSIKILYLNTLVALSVRLND